MMNDKELLDIYTDYLISSFGLTTQTGLSRLLNDAISHDRVQRFLSKDPKTGKDLWLTVKPYVRQIQSADGISASWMSSNVIAPFQPVG